MLEALASFPVLLLSFIFFLFNIFPIYKSLIDPGDRQSKLVYFLGVSASLTLYYVVGIFGYMTYGSEIETNYLKSIKEEQVIIKKKEILNADFF